MTNPQETHDESADGIQDPPAGSLIPRNYYPFILLILVLLVIGALLLASLLPQGGGSASPEPLPTLSPPATPVPGASSPSAFPSGTPNLSAIATASPTYSGPPDFSLSASPLSTSARRGETVTYTMVIDGKNGFSSPVTLELTATALFVTRTYDFGTYDPPFPKTIKYPFTVPDYLPPGVTVDGTLRANGGGLVREDRLTLQVGY